MDILNNFNQNVHIQVTMYIYRSDPLRAGAYRWEIISAALRRSGMVHSIKIFRYSPDFGGVN